jgi:hypothetical protein
MSSQDGGVSVSHHKPLFPVYNLPILLVEPNNMGMTRTIVHILEECLQRCLFALSFTLDLDKSREKEFVNSP